jgi:Recombination endonuclease VII
MTMCEIITRAEALSKGLKRYRVEWTCKYGHVNPERSMRTYNCCECHRDCVRAHESTPEGQTAKVARYVANREVRLTYQATYRAENADVIRAKKAADYATPEGKARAMKRKYNIPLWLGTYLAEHMVTGNCPGCGVKFGQPKSMTRACVDHDHDTGEVRMIVCSLCNTHSLSRCDDGRDPDAVLLAAGRNVKHGERLATALIQLRLAALLIDHYAPRSPLVAKALSIPMPTT